MKPNPTENCPLDIEDCVCARCPYRVAHPDSIGVESPDYVGEEMEISAAPPWLTRLLVTALGIGAVLGTVWIILLLIRAIAFFDFS